MTNNRWELTSNTYFFAPTITTLSRPSEAWYILSLIEYYFSIPLKVINMSVRWMGNIFEIISRNSDFFSRKMSSGLPTPRKASLVSSHYYTRFSNGEQFEWKSIVLLSEKWRIMSFGECIPNSNTIWMSKFHCPRVPHHVGS